LNAFINSCSVSGDTKLAPESSSTFIKSSLRVIPNLFATWLAQLRAWDALCAKGLAVSKTLALDDE
jgi:hypothetical protein